MMTRLDLPKTQTGVVLIVGLVLLLLLSLIGVTAMQSTALEEKMAGNSRDRNTAFQAAEAALQDAEDYLDSGAPPFNPLKLTSGGPFQNATAPLCANGLCPLPPVTVPPTAPYWSVSGFNWSTYGLAYGSQTGATAITGVSAQPRYVIEFMGTCPLDTDVNRCLATMRVTARAWGANSATVVQLQTFVKVKVKSFAN
jgi:type IV pilus assembly protein PilX